MSKLRTTRFAIALSLLQLTVVISQPGVAAEADPLFDEEFEEEGLGFPDPLESVNRPILSFNRVFDRFVLNPITRVYGWVIPSPLKQSIRRVFDNAHSPPVIANDLFQGEWSDAGVATARFVVNTTLGVAGLFDAARHMGLEEHDSDFGQTLALYGLPSGPYLMVPVLGPTTIRQGTGVLVDSFLSPTMYLIGPGELLFYWYAGGRGIAAREKHMRQIMALEASSVDYYAALRNAYYQNRIAEIWKRREHWRPTTSAKLVGVTSPSPWRDP